MASDAAKRFRPKPEETPGENRGTQRHGLRLLPSFPSVAASSYGISENFGPGFSLLQETTQRRPFFPSRGASPRSSHDHGARHAFLRPCFPCPHGMKKPVLRGGTPAVNTAPHRAARHVSKTTKAAECRRASSCRLRLWSRRSARLRAPVRDGRRAGPRA